MSAGWTMGSFLSSGRSLATTNRLIKVGPVLSAVSLLLLAALMPLSDWNGGGNGVIAALLGVGMGVGLCWPNLLTRVFKSAPAGQENIASSAITTLQLYAMAMGASLAGMVTNAAGFLDPGGIVGTQQAAIALFAVFACAPGLAVFISGGARRAGSIGEKPA